MGVFHGLSYVPLIACDHSRNWKIIALLEGRGYGITHWVRSQNISKNISEHLIRTHKCAYQGVRNVSFGENFAYVLSEWSLWVSQKSGQFWNRMGLIYLASIFGLEGKEIPGYFEEFLKLPKSLGIF